MVRAWNSESSEKSKHNKNHPQSHPNLFLNALKQMNILRIKILFHAFIVILWEFPHVLSSTQKRYVTILPEYMP